MIDQDLKNLNEPLKKNGTNQTYLVEDSIWLDELGDSHQTTSIETPVNTEYLNKSDAEKMVKIQHHFKEILETL
jgi:GTP cyclohydrolase I